MRLTYLGLCLALLAGPAAAQSEDPMVRAEELGYCDSAGVKSAKYLSTGALHIICKGAFSSAG